MSIVNLSPSLHFVRHERKRCWFVFRTHFFRKSALVAFEGHQLPGQDVLDGVILVQAGLHRGHYLGPGLFCDESPVI